MTDLVLPSDCAGDSRHHPSRRERSGGNGIVLPMWALSIAGGVLLLVISGFTTWAYTIERRTSDTESKTQSLETGQGFMKDSLNRIEDKLDRALERQRVGQP